MILIFTKYRLHYNVAIVSVNYGQVVYSNVATAVRLVIMQCGDHVNFEIGYPAKWEHLGEKIVQMDGK